MRRPRADTEPNIELEEIMRLEREAHMSPEKLADRHKVEAQIKGDQLKPSTTPYSLIEKAVEDPSTYGDLLCLYTQTSGQYARMAELTLVSNSPELAVGICESANRKDLAEKLKSHMEGQFFETFQSHEDAIQSYKEAGSVRSVYHILISLDREDEAKAYVEEQMGVLMKEAEDTGYYGHAIWAVGVAEPDFQEEFIAHAYQTLENQEKFGEGFHLAKKLGDVERAAVFKELAELSK